MTPLAQGMDSGMGDLGLASLLCTKRKQPVTIANSKPTGRNALLRIGTNCAGAKKMMERRLQGRPEKDPLKAWWKELQRKPDELAKWYCNMKIKQAYAKMSNEEIMTMVGGQEHRH